MSNYFNTTAPAAGKAEIDRHAPAVLNQFIASAIH
jgi:hypothetical protein